MKKTPSNDLQNDDQQENSRRENEILRLKLSAELGTEANFIAGIPPVLENLFMHNILAIEHAAARGKKIILYEFLKKPDFKYENEIADHLIDQHFEELTEMLVKNNIVVEFIGIYGSRTKYKFITEELFEHPVDDFSVPGMISHYIYEDFHPDHKADIKTRTADFLTQFFDRSINHKSWELADQIVIPDRRIISKSETVEKLQNLFECYTSFSDHEFVIADVSFEFKNEFGMGYAEGRLKYNAISENDEVIRFEGPFKFYLSMDLTWWSIFYFTIPGFEL